VNSTLFTTAVPALYLATLAALGTYGVHRLWMLARLRWPVPDGLGGRPCGAERPAVTVQLPLYNERNVAARLIRAVGALEYPRERLEIQVLDDSSDETRAIVDEEVRALVRRGLDARVVRRADRTGFKAGALAHGLRSARGTLIAIFDADFVPRPDFLERLVPAFQDERVGMVQARWEHLDRDASLLARAQAVLLDGHFVIEHSVRYANGFFFNFNGTAGILRRAAIEGAGGWQHDTLTEDLDLSYRAQLAGWRFVYAPEVTTPSEVPGDVAAFLGQQNRWARGSAQVARKLAGRILRAPLALAVKREALAHLTANAGYPLVMLLALLLPLVAAGGTRVPEAWQLAAFLACTFSVIAFYDTSQRVLGRPAWKRALDVPAAMALGVGISLAQTRAVLAGFLRPTGEFVRTPKRGDAPVRLYAGRLHGAPGLELLLAAWLAWALVLAALHGQWGSLPFLALFCAGFAWVGALSLGSALRDRSSSAADVVRVYPSEARAMIHASARRRTRAHASSAVHQVAAVGPTKAAPK
jgi:hypothetical protein